MQARTVCNYSVVRHLSAIYRHSLSRVAYLHVPCETIDLNAQIGSATLSHLRTLPTYTTYFVCVVQH
jgi:hypothetical protein